MAMRTDQQLFDIMYLGVLKQGKPSVNNGGCQYRGPNGLKCAAGMLIADRDYILEIEGEDAKVARERGALKIKKSQVELALKMQIAHDKNSSFYSNFRWLKNFKKQAKAVAKKFGLVVPDLPA
ncbi:MAG: hypothetical protein ACEQSB_00085 [Undibacterium sp.]